jgi:hypothetical protein
MESLLIGLRIMALLTLARWLTPSTVTLSSLAKGLSTLTLAYTPIHALVFWLLQESGGVATCLTGAIGGSIIAFVVVLGVKRLVGNTIGEAGWPGVTPDDGSGVVRAPYSGSLDVQYVSVTGTGASQQTDPVDST